jgi:hypothetical protein
MESQRCLERYRSETSSGKPEQKAYQSPTTQPYRVCNLLSPISIHTRSLRCPANRNRSRHRAKHQHPNIPASEALAPSLIPQHDYSSPLRIYRSHGFLAKGLRSKRSLDKRPDHLAILSQVGVWRPPRLQAHHTLEIVAELVIVVLCAVSTTFAVVAVYLLQRPW